MKRSLLFVALLSLVLGVFACGQSRWALTAAPSNVETRKIIPISGLQKLPNLIINEESSTEMPPDPLEMDDTTKRPPDPLEANGITKMPDDPFGETKETQMPPDSVEMNNTTKRPPDPLEMPVDPLEMNDTTRRPPDPFGQQVNQENLQAGMITITKAVQSLSEIDLEKEDAFPLFVKEVQNTVPTVREVDIQDNSVNISYERKAKFLGFIPVTYQLKIQGDSETGILKVKKPWWIFLTKNDANKFEESLEDKDTKDTLWEMSALVGLKLQIAIERRAKMIELLSNMIKKISETEDSIVENIK